MDTEYWFKPKPTGYGARPCHWKGWAVLALFIMGQVFLAMSMLSSSGGSGNMSGTQFMIWFFLFTLLTWGFIRFCKWRTDGEWKWRDGREAQ